MFAVVHEEFRNHGMFKMFAEVYEFGDLGRFEEVGNYSLIVWQNLEVFTWHRVRSTGHLFLQESNE